MAKAGRVYDDAGVYLGKYIWLEDRKDQNYLDEFVDSWLKTYYQDQRFELALDLETSGLDYISGDILLFSISWNGEDALIFDPFHFDLTKLKEALGTLPINNTNTKFDAKWIYSKYGIEIDIAFDAMAAAQLGWTGIFPGKRFGLDNLAKQILKLKLEKTTRESFIGGVPGQAYTTEQIEYAVKDSIVTFRLKKPILNRLIDQKLLAIWEDIELPLIQTMIRSEFQGVLIDVETLDKIYVDKQKELKEVYEELTKELEKYPKLPKFTKGVFNPGSYQQVHAVLALEGIKIKSTEGEVMEEALHENPNSNLLRLIIKWRSIKTQISKELEGMLNEYINPVTKCIHPNYITCGTETGRLACVDRNTLIETSEGPKKIVDLVSNQDYVKTHTGAFKEVLALIYKGKDELFEVELENGSKIICTKEHKFLTESGWESLGNLENNSILDIELISYEQT